MSELKNHIHVVELVNEKLHRDLKMVTVENSIREQTLFDASVSPGIFKMRDHVNSLT